VVIVAKVGQTFVIPIVAFHAHQLLALVSIGTAAVAAIQRGLRDLDGRPTSVGKGRCCRIDVVLVLIRSKIVQIPRTVDNVDATIAGSRGAFHLVQLPDNYRIIFRIVVLVRTIVILA
jgi:hypothetical protein